MSSSVNRPPSAKESLIAGSLSGMSSIVVCHPLDLLRTKMQINPMLNFSTVLKTTLRENGLPSLYHGVTAPFFAQAVYKSIIFATNTLSNRYLFHGSTDFISIFGGGLIAGSVNSLVCAPVEVIRTRQIVGARTNPNLSIYSVVASIYVNKGLKGFWISFLPTVIRDGPGVGFYMYAFDASKRYIASKIPMESKDSAMIWTRLVSGAFAGIAFWTWGLPVDYIKTAIESNHSATGFNWRNLVHGNLKNLYKALPIAYLRGIPSAAVTLTVYDLTLEKIMRTGYLS